MLEDGLYQYFTRPPGANLASRALAVEISATDEDATAHPDANRHVNSNLNRRLLFKKGTAHLASLRTTSVPKGDTPARKCLPKGRLRGSADGRERLRTTVVSRSVM
jgi:hypothetical protein